MQQANGQAKSALLIDILHPQVERLAQTLHIGTAVLSCDGTVLSSSQWPSSCTPSFCLPPTPDCLAHKNKTASGRSPRTLLCKAGCRFASVPVLAAENQIATLLIGPFHLLDPEKECADVPVALQNGRCPSEKNILVLSPQEQALVLAHLETTSELMGYKVDLDAHRHTEKVLRESQDQLQSFFEAVPLGLVVSHHKTILKVNKKFCEITGYPPKELVNKSTRCFYLNDQEFARVSLELTQSMWEMGKVGYAEASCVCKNGAVRDVALYAAPIDENNPNGGAAIVVQDITQQKQNEATLRLNRDTLQSLFAAAPVGLSIIRKRHLYSVNERLCDITGYTADELILMPIRQLYASEEEYNRVGQALYTALWQSGRTEVETRLVRKDGTVRDVFLSLAPIDLENREAGVAAATQDITERKKNEQVLLQQQATLQSLFNAVPIGLVIMKNRTFAAVNKGLCDITGCSAEELINTSPRKFYESNDEFCRVRDDLYGDLWTSGKHKYVETRLIRQDGTFRDVALSAAPIDLEDSEAGVAVAVQDITEQKLALQQLRENEARFRIIADFTGQLLFDHDMNSDRLIWSGRAEEMTGYPLAELNRQGLEGWVQHVHPDDRDQVMAFVQETLKSGLPFHTNYRFQKADSTLIYVEAEGAVYYDDRQQPQRMLGIIRDVTTRMVSEQRLQESESRYRAMFNLAGNAILILDDDVIIDCNQRALELFHATREQLLGQTPLGLSPQLQGDGRPSHDKLMEFKRKILAGNLQKFEWVHQRFDGEPFQVEIYLNPIELSGRMHVYVSLRDITDRKQAEKALRESEFRFRSFYNTNPEGIVLLDFQGYVLDVNKAFLRDSGYNQSQCVGHHFMEFVPDEQIQAQFIESIIALKAGISKHTALEGSYKTAVGTLLPVAVRGWLVVDEESRPLYIGVFIQNLAKEKALSEEKAALEKQIIQAQKSEAIGTLAGGIAHDFNNILGGLIGYTELALLQTPDTKGNTAREYMKRALEVGFRAKELVQQILRFSRHSQAKNEPINIVPIVKEAVRLLRSTIPTTIDIRQEININDDRILGDATQMHQVLMNLATNGYHAMRECGGILSITLDQVHLALPKQSLSMEIQPGDYLQLSVADTGTGIPPTVLERVFEPYFTTKEVNEGTGLGLAVTLGIIKSHQGLIEVETEPGRGTCFSIYLPLVSAAIKEQQIKTRLSVGHGERILIVDDEAYFREVIGEGLRLLGYEVVTRSSSLQALDTFKNNPLDFDLLLTDQTMPDMSGTQLAQQVLAINAHLPIILCTGFSESITKKNASNFGISKLLMKPINIEELATAVHEVLQAAQASNDQ